MYRPLQIIRMSQEELQTLAAPQFGLQSVWTGQAHHASHAVIVSLSVLAAPLQAQSVLGGTLQLIHRVLLQNYRQSEVALVQMLLGGSYMKQYGFVKTRCSVLVYILFQSFKVLRQTYKWMEIANYKKITMGGYVTFPTQEGFKSRCSEMQLTDL